MPKYHSQKHAFSLIEVLISVAIVSILAVALTLSFRNSRQKAEDSEVKGDLNRLRIAFDDYYNDHNCYPPTTWFDDTTDCGSNQLAPYLSTIPCSTKTNLPYPIEKDPTGCSWYKIYGILNNENDPQSQALQSESGSSLGNYGVSSSNTTPYVTGIVNPLASPTGEGGETTPETPTYYCSAINNCSAFDPSLFNCTPSYTSPNCDGIGGCNQAGVCRSR